MVNFKKSMTDVIMISAGSYNKILKKIQRKLMKEGIECSVLKSPVEAVNKVRKYFKLGYGKLPAVKPLKVADCTIDPEEYILKNEHFEVILRKKEFELIRFFLANENKTLNRNIILENVWGPTNTLFTNTVDVHVASLRKKLPKNLADSLKTIHGVGYKFVV